MLAFSTALFWAKEWNNQMTVLKIHPPWNLWPNLNYLQELTLLFYGKSSNLRIWLREKCYWMKPWAARSPHPMGRSSCRTKGSIPHFTRNTRPNSGVSLLIFVLKFHSPLMIHLVKLPAHRSAWIKQLFLHRSQTENGRSRHICQWLND